MYDVIIHSYNEYEHLRNMKIRSLNYRYIGNNNHIVLSHPKFIINASLHKIKIFNMNECINLKNFYSYNNIYTEPDIKNFTNLKRIWSHYDTY